MKDPWFYLSFAGEDGFLGAVVSRGRNVHDAYLRAKAKGVTPVGQVLGVPIPENQIPHARFRHRLLGHHDLIDMWVDVRSLGEWESCQ